MNRRPAGLLNRDMLRHRNAAYRRWRTRTYPQAMRRTNRLEGVYWRLVQKISYVDIRDAIRIEARLRRVVALMQVESEGMGAAGHAAIAYYAANREAVREAVA